MDLSILLRRKHETKGHNSHAGLAALFLLADPARLVDPKTHSEPRDHVNSVIQLLDMSVTCILIANFNNGERKIMKSDS